ncbi:uncharacterized protein LOC116925609 [Daphnia magna]|nr:uncharacterized protein LOC116925609 [Daphnia magna]
MMPTSADYEISIDEHHSPANANHRAQKMIGEVNNLVAQFRQLLIIIGQPKDSPDVREKIRRLRRQCVESCKHTNQLLLPQIHSDIAAGIPLDTDHVIHFFCSCQLLVRELHKSHRLIQRKPLDMTSFYENRAGPSNLGTVFSQIILCKQLAPDFNAEELRSIRKDSEDLQRLIDDLSEFMPMEESYGRAFALAGEDKFSVWAKKRMLTNRRQRVTISNPLCRNIRALCCFSKPSYL